QLVGKLKEQGLYAYARWNMLMICPPLCITQDQLAWALELIDDALSIVDEYKD
ncbi:MAG: aspartate aminotransferase family protein, partial [Proteobacteria bacterium]|nr:aspartate aminotransferase family protein [Pseudomonadota bacterium]